MRLGAWSCAPGMRSKVRQTLMQKIIQVLEAVRTSRCLHACRTMFAYALSAWREAVQKAETRSFQGAKPEVCLRSERVPGALTS